MQSQLINILIINASPSEKNKLHDYLSIHGYNIIVSPSINKAFDILTEKTIDTIIFENIEPTMDGYSKLHFFEEHLRQEKIKTLSMITEKAS